MRRIVFGLLLIVPVMFGLLHPAAAQADCGSGVPQRLVVGQAARVIPGQSANRLRAAPGGNQIGAIQPDEIFTVTGGPECSNSVSWWEVETADGKTGWTGEGVGGAAFLEPVASGGGGGGADDDRGGGGGPVTTVETQDCSAAPAPQLKTGMVVEPAVPVDTIEQFYGDPRTTAFQAIRTPAEDWETSWKLLDANYALEDLRVVVYEGPVCYQGRYMWKLGPVQSIDTWRPLVWIAELADGKAQFAPASETFDPVSPFTPKRIDIALEEAAPIISADEQIVFAPGGGCGGWGCLGPGLWYPDSEDLQCLVGWWMADIIYYQPDCADIFLPAPDDEVQVIIRQPDGTAYQELTLSSHVINYMFDPDSDAVTTFDDVVPVPLNMVRVDLYHEVGDAEGLWTIEVTSGSYKTAVSYLVRPAVPTLLRRCEGSRAVITAYGYPEEMAKDLVLLRMTGIEIRGSGDQAEVGAVFEEDHRWSLTTGRQGELMLELHSPMPEGEFYLVDPGKVAVYDHTAEYDMSVPYSCPSAATVSDAAAHPIEYGTVSFGRFITLDEYNEAVGSIQETYYVFQGQQNDLVSIEALSFEVLPEEYGAFQTEAIDLKIQLLDANGTVIAENDDADPAGTLPTDSALRDFVLPEAGLYTIQMSYNNKSLENAVDGYTLILSGIPAAGGGAPQPVDLSYGRLASANLADKSVWTFAGAAGDMVTINAQTSEFDIKIALNDAAGEILAEDDDSGDSFLNARISAFTLPATGVYSIEVAGWNDKTGSYQLTVSR